MRENTLRKIWARGEAVVNGWLSIPSAFSAEVMAHQGFDSLDHRHAARRRRLPGGGDACCRRISTTRVVPLARVPWNDPARLMKILDAGAYGVICPMINTRAGGGGAGAARASTRRAATGAGVRCAPRSTPAPTTATTPTTTLIVMPMIETAEALKNLDEILSVPGVDAIYVGPSDLSLALGCKPRLDQTDAPVVEAQQKIVEACKRHGVVAGIHNATAAYSLKMIDGGLPVRDHRQRQPLPRREGGRGGAASCGRPAPRPASCPPTRVPRGSTTRCSTGRAPTWRAFERRRCPTTGGGGPRSALVLLPDDGRPPVLSHHAARGDAAQARAASGRCPAAASTRARPPSGPRCASCRRRSA